MRTATVRDLRNHYTSVLGWVKEGEEVLITQRGKSIARLIPEPIVVKPMVDWSQSEVVLRDRSGDICLTAEESAALIADAASKW